MKIFLTKQDFVMHVVDDELMFNDETGDVLAVCRNAKTEEEYGALIPGTAIAYVEMKVSDVRDGIAAAKAAQARIKEPV